MLFEQTSGWDITRFILLTAATGLIVFGLYQLFRLYGLAGLNWIAIFFIIISPILLGFAWSLRKNNRKANDRDKQGLFKNR